MLFFTFKTLFVFEIFQLLFWIFGHLENILIRKLIPVSKFMTSKSGQQTIAIHILPNISSKSNQTMTFCQLKLTSHGILHYLWSAELSKSFPQLISSIFTFLNIFFNRFCPLGSHTQNVVEELVTNPFLKNQCLWIKSVRFYTVCFCCMRKWRAIERCWS